MRELVDRSSWLASTPGLADHVRRWLDEVPPLRDAAEARGARLARPRATRLSTLGVSRTATRLAPLLALAVRDWTYALVLRGRVVTAAPRPSGVTRYAERVVRAGGPAYVKLGQFIASARGMVSDELVDSMQWCTDQVAPLPPGVASATIARSLGRPVSSLFASFDEVPMAAASIAQVHRATLHDGTEVVVKVRRPGLSRRFAADISAMAVLAWAASRVSARARMANLPAVIDLFSRLCMQELDLRIEALNMVQVGLAVEDAGQHRMRVPRPVAGLVSRDVLVMERLPGVRYSDAGAHYPEALDGPELLRIAVSHVLEHALLYGVFHGDLHAGNVLLDESGTFSLVDFGIVGRLDARERRSLMRFNIGSANKDAMLQLKGMQELGAIPASADLDALAPLFDAQQERLDALMNRPRDEVSFAELGTESARMVKLMLQHGFRLPVALVLFSKNMLYLNALADAVAPDANVIQEMDNVLPYFLEKYPELIASLLVDVTPAS